MPYLKPEFLGRPLEPTGKMEWVIDCCKFCRSKNGSSCDRGGAIKDLNYCEHFRRR